MSSRHAQAGGEPQSAWVRFVGDGALSGLTLEASLELAVVAGERQGEHRMRPLQAACRVYQSAASDAN